MRAPTNVTGEPGHGHRTGSRGAAFLLAALVALAGCEVIDPPVESTVTGIVRVPAGDARQAARPGTTLGQRMLAWLGGRSVQAELRGQVALAGVTVELVELQESGEPGRLIDTAVTDADGVYRIDSLPIVTSPLAVRVRPSDLPPGPDPETPARGLSALVTGPTVDITPATEAVVRTLLEDIVAPSTGEVPLSNFEGPEVAALVRLVGAMDLDLSGRSTEEAVSLIQTESAPLLREIAERLAGPGIVTTLQNTDFGGVDLASVLIEPGPAESDDRGVELRSGAANWGFDAFDLGVGEAFGLRMRHDLDIVRPPVESPLGAISLEHIVTEDGRVIVGNAADATALGVLTGDARFMAYPLLIRERSGATRGHGIRLAMRKAATQLGPTVLDPAGEGGTDYHLVRLSQRFSAAATGQNAVAVSAETGTLRFDRAPGSEVALPGTTAPGRGMRSVGAIAADRLLIDLVSGRILADDGPPPPIDGAYQVTPDGAINFFHVDGRALGQGFTTEAGDIVGIQSATELVQIPLDVLANDRDPDAGDRLAIVDIEPSGGFSGTVSLNAARDRILYIPPPNAEPGTDRLEYTVSDGLATATATVRIRRVPRDDNSPPIAEDDAFAVAFESTDNVLDVLANDTDPDLNQRLVLIGVTTGEDFPEGATVEIVDNRLEYTPAPGHVGEVHFSYEVGDGVGSRASGGTATATVAVMTLAEGENSPPVAVDDEFRVVAGRREGPIRLDVLANDEDLDVGDVLTITSVDVGDAAGFAGELEIAEGGGALLYTPPEDFDGEPAQVSFAYTVTDGTDEATATVQLELRGQNSQPVVVDDTWNLVLPDDPARWSTNVAQREVGLLLRKGEGLDNAVLSGTYHLVQHGSAFPAGGGGIESAHGYGALRFTGQGGLSGRTLFIHRTGLDLEAARAGSPSLLRTGAQDRLNVTGGRYEIDEEGRLTLTVEAGEGEDTLVLSGSGAISPDGEVGVVTARIERGGVDVGRALIVLAREVPGSVP